MAKSKPEHPEHPEHPDHPIPPEHPLAARVVGKAKAKGHQHDVATDLLVTRPATHMAALIEQARLRPDTAAAAQQEGDERLQETLDTILESCLYAKEVSESAGLPVSATLTRAIEGLRHAVGEGPPVATQLPA